MHTGRPACRNRLARSTARWNWFDCARPSDEGRATGSVNHADDPVGPDAGVGLVIGVDADRHIRAKQPAPARIFGETVEAGESVRRDRRLDPPDSIAVVIVMSRLDKHQVEDRGVAWLSSQIGSGRSQFRTS